MLKDDNTQTRDCCLGVILVARVTARCYVYHHMLIVLKYI